MSRKEKLTHTSVPVKASLVIMGTGQLLYRQWTKGLLYLTVLVATCFYMVTTGIYDIVGFFTLGTKEADPWLGTEGDDSVMMLLKGLLAFAIIIAFLIIHRSNVHDILECDRQVRGGNKLPGFSKAVSIFLDKKFYLIALAIPVTGVLIFNVLPILFMILISFTNYGGDIVPPKLVDWIGLANFLFSGYRR